MNTKRMRNRTGQSAIEAVLVTLVFIACLIGIFDLGQVLFVHQTFVARARAAARYGALHPADKVAIQSMVLHGTPEGSGTGIFGLQSSMVAVARSDNGTSEDRLTVSITGYSYRLFSPWIGQSFNGNTITASFPVETP